MRNRKFYKGICVSLASVLAFATMNLTTILAVEKNNAENEIQVNQNKSWNPDTDVVTIPNVNLKKAVNSAIDGSRPADQNITKTEMETVKIIRSLDDNIDNLEGLQYAVNLEEFRINAKGLIDLAPISKITSLKILQLVDSSVSDMSVMENNSNLIDLFIYPKYSSANDFGTSPETLCDNRTVEQIADRFPNLKRLNLSGYLNGDQFDSTNHPTKSGLITDITPLSKLINLKNVNLNQNSIKDFSPLVDTVNVGLSYEQIFFLENAYFDAAEDGSKPYYMDVPKMIDVKGNIVEGTPVKLNLVKPDKTYKLKGASSIINGNICLMFQTLDTFSTKPEISATDKTINVGEEFNPLEGVTATDRQDGEITLTMDNIIFNNVDVNSAGTYMVEYSVTDNSGLTTTKSINVTVLDVDYNVEIYGNIMNGKVIPSLPEGDTTYNSGDIVTLTVTPNQDYRLTENSLRITTSGGAEVPLTELTRMSNGSYSFTMPTDNVIVTARFELIPVVSPPVIEKPTEQTKPETGKNPTTGTNGIVGLLGTIGIAGLAAIITKKRRNK